MARLRFAEAVPLPNRFSEELIWTNLQYAATNGRANEHCLSPQTFR